MDWEYVRFRIEELASSFRQKNNSCFCTCISGLIQEVNKTWPFDSIKKRHDDRKW